MDAPTLRRRVRALVAFFVAALVLSGLTAIPLQWEAGLLERLAGPASALGGRWPALAEWVARIRQGLDATGRDYPFVLYGTDWLAFAHFVIAVAFWGVWKDPVRNRWVIEFGLIACALIIPAALIFGQLRGIPFFWRLLDCSFGVGGFLPLWITRRYILRLEALERAAGAAPPAPAAGAAPPAAPG